MISKIKCLVDKSLRIFLNLLNKKLSYEQLKLYLLGLLQLSYFKHHNIRPKALKLELILLLQLFD